MFLMTVNLRTHKSFQPNNEDSPVVVSFRFIAVSACLIHEVNWIKTFSQCIMGNWSSVKTSLRKRAHTQRPAKRNAACNGCVPNGVMCSVHFFLCVHPPVHATYMYRFSLIAEHYIY